MSTNTWHGLDELRANRSVNSRSKRPTFGLLTHGAGDPNSHTIWAAVASVAQAQDVNLICFPGKPLHSPHGFEAQSNVLYDLVNEEELDGLVIWLAALTHQADLKEVKQFCARYRSFPIVTVGVLVKDIPGVLVDNYQGMRDVITHLIDEHGHSRIAFIRGPELHQEAEDRYRAYVNVLADYGIPFDPDLVVVGDFRESGGVAAIDVLVDQRKVRFDALVAASDNMAVGAMNMLQARGIRIPADVAIASLNDESQSEIATPPLTTSSLRFYEQACRAAEMVLALLQGEQVPQQVILPSRLLTRQSCGCPDPLAIQATEKTILFHGVTIDAILAGQRGHILTAMLQSVEILSASFDAVWVERLLDAFTNEIVYRMGGAFLRVLEEALRQSAAAGGKLSRWHGAITLLRHHILPCLENAEIVRRAETLWQQAQLMIGETAQRAQAYQALQTKQRASTLAEINQMLSATLGISELTDVLAHVLPQLNISSCYLSLYEDPKLLTGRSNLIFAYDKNGRINLDDREHRFPSRQLLPDGFFPVDSRYSFTVEPLYFRDDQLGFVLFEADPYEEEVYEILRGQISSALKRILLVAHNAQLYDEAVKAWQLAEQRQRLAEDANMLKGRFLATVSHELRTPLSLIVGTIEMMLREGTAGRVSLPESYHRDLQGIHASAQYLAHLIGDVLDLASTQAGELRLTCESLNLWDILQKITVLGEAMARAKGLAWRATIPQNLPMVWGDRTRLQQVVLNLISNAVKFTEHGEVTLAVATDEREVTITVSDTGIGIPVEEQGTIFDEFRQSVRTTQRGYGGMGLGLALSRHLIELHGGKIGVQSSGEEGAGSAFYFTLSLRQTPPFARQNVGGREPSVVLVARRTDTRNPLGTHLAQRGFKVENLGIETSPDWLANVVRLVPGAVVLDVDPAAEVGWELMKLLKSDPVTRDVPVVFYSLSEKHDCGSMLGLDYLTKPVGSLELARALERQGVGRNGRKHGQTVLVVDDEPGILDLHARIVQDNLPGCRVLKAHSGREALNLMEQERPDLVLLDLMMPEVDGFAVLEAKQTSEIIRSVPVIVLTAQILTASDMARLQQGVAAVLGKGLFSVEEVLAQVEAILARSKRLGSAAQRIVRQAMSYIHDHHAEEISVDSMARAFGLSERHLNRCFRQDTGVSIMTYLNRYRINQAKQLLKNGASVTEAALAVGFSDSNYFGRVFRREVGIPPTTYQRDERLAPS